MLHISILFIFTVSILCCILSRGLIVASFPVSFPTLLSFWVIPHIDLPISFLYTNVSNSKIFSAPIFWKFKTRFLGLTFNIFCLTDVIWQSYLPVLFYLRSIPTRLLCLQFSTCAFPPRWMPFSFGISTSLPWCLRPLLMYKCFLCKAHQQHLYAFILHTSLPTFRSGWWLPGGQRGTCGCW